MRNIFKDFRNWLKRDVIEIRVFDPHKGIIKEKDLESIVIRGKIFAEDPQKTRKIISQGTSSMMSINPPFLDLLCPAKEKRTVHQLIQSEEGKFLLIVQGVSPNE